MFTPRRDRNGTTHRSSPTQSLIVHLLLIGIFSLIPASPVFAACPTFPYTVPASDEAALINAINCANGTGSTETINLTDSTYTFTTVSDDYYTALPTIEGGSGGLIIDGNGATIQRSTAAGTPEFRLFYISDTANVRLVDMTISNGYLSSASGGAIRSSGTLTLQDVTIKDNTAETGGGVYNIAGTLITNASTFFNNTSLRGGAILNDGGELSMTNSTISGNHATGTGGYDGGGALKTFSAEPVQITNSTITQNDAARPNYSGVWNSAGNLQIQNSIVADNAGEYNCAGSITDGGNNLEDGVACNFGGAVGEDTEPSLRGLHNNGGATETHRLEYNSPAINAGSNGKAVFNNGNPLVYDQRGSGYPRIVGGTVDIGAYESACPVFPYTVPASDEAALIEAIDCANGMPSNDVITLTAGSTYTLTEIITFNTGLPRIVDEATGGTLTINGNGATIERSTAGDAEEIRFFYVNSGGNLTLNRVTLSNGNTGTWFGGAILNYGTLAVNSSTITGNMAQSGGGIYNLGTITVTGSTLSDNTATYNGGGFVNNGGTFRLINSTISGNHSTGAVAYGGGALQSTDAASVTQITNSTITGNIAAVASRSGIWVQAGTVTIQNSIVANNNGANNCSGSVTDGGNNLDSGTSCGFGGAVGQNTSPLLGTLANNGGATQTHALLTGSPAINAGDNSKAVDGSGAALTSDQRGAGYPRVLGGRVDIGAYEIGCPSFPHTVPAGNEPDLNFSIACANSNGAGTNDVINLTSSTYSLTSEYASSTGLPRIENAANDGTLTINGNGSEIRRSTLAGIPEFRLLDLFSGSDLTLNNLILRNGSVPSDYGGAISNNGELTLSSVTLLENSAMYAGGIFNSSVSASLMIENSTFSSNEATRFGGGILNNGGEIWLINSTISGNAANGATTNDGGGGLQTYGSTGAAVHLINSTVANNTSAVAERSGIWVQAGTIYFYNSIVANNNGANNCARTGGTFVVGQSNLDNGTSCGFMGALGQNTNPMLAGLADNGGSTRTHALLPGSPAINAGSDAQAVDEAGTPLTTDQRGAGYPRIVGDSVDIGAFEAECPSFPYTVSAGNTPDLIFAIDCANANATNDVINLTHSTYTLAAIEESSTGLPRIVSAATVGNLTINGNGATIQRSSDAGTPNFRLFYVNSGGHLTLNSLTVSGGSLSAAGGAIYNLGAVFLNDTTLRDNFASSGGGLYNSGSAIVTRTTVSGNSVSGLGGGLLNFGGVLGIYNSTLSGNSAVSGGAAVESYGTGAVVQITNSTITNNSATSTTLSGVVMENGSMQIQNSIVANNNGTNNCAFLVGTFTDGGYNLDNGTSCGFSGAVGQNTNPLMGALADNGGLTETHALRPGSPAINAGNNAKAVDPYGNPLGTDQRGTGYPRIYGGTVDIGAFEAQMATLNVTVTLQGRSNPTPHASYVTTIHVRAATTSGGTPIYSHDFTTNQSGGFTISALTEGGYYITFKGTHSLAQEHRLFLNAGANNLTTDLLYEGDSNDSNGVTIGDFSILAATFGKANGQAGYDARADFNGDNAITIADFSLLASNFGKVGDGGVTP